MKCVNLVYKYKEALNMDDINNVRYKLLYKVCEELFSLHIIKKSTEIFLKRAPRKVFMKGYICNANRKDSFKWFISNFCAVFQHKNHSEQFCAAMIDCLEVTMVYHT